MTSARQKNQFSVSDLASFLYEKYQQAASEGTHNPVADPHGAVADFLTFARSYLSQNLPTGIFYLTQGFGLRLPSGEQVAFGTNQAQEEMAMRDEGIPITLPARRERSLDSGSIGI